MSKESFLTVDLSILSAEEKEIIDLLTEVGRVVHQIWEKQVDPVTKEAHFYPRNIKQEQIILDSQRNPQILSPYTLVKLSDSGELITENYRDAYHSEIDKIVELLKQASDLSSDSILKKYLSDLAKNFDLGDFDAALATYLQNGDSKIEVLMGPIETYLDKLMGVKKAFQFNLRIKHSGDLPMQKEIANIVKAVAVLKPYLSEIESVPENKVSLRVDDVVMFSGRQANTMTISTNLPDKPEVIKEHGVKILIYRNSLDNKFDNKIKNLLAVISHESLADSILKNALLKLIVLHEVCEVTIKFPKMQERLEGQFDAVREINAYLMAIETAKVHMLSGVITEDDLKSLAFAFIVQGLDKVLRRDSDPSIMEYARGFASVFNYAMKRGHLTVKNGMISVDIPEFTNDIGIISKVILNIFAKGTSVEAEKFFKEYADFSFASELKQIDY